MARPTGDSARERLELFTWISAYLFQHGGRVTIADAAQKYGTTENKVVSAITTVGCAGASGEASKGLQHDIFDIDWDLLESDGIIQLLVADVLTKPVQFSARHKATLLAGLRILGTHPRYRNLPEFHGLVEKLGGTNVAALDSMGIDVSLATDSVKALVSAQGRNKISFGYVNKQGVASHREADPYLLHTEDNSLYVKAWCYKSSAVRTFDVSRMTNVTVLDIPVDDTLVSPFTLNENLFERTESDVVVTLTMAASAVPLITEFIPAGEAATVVGDTATVRIPFVHVGRLVRLVMGLPGIVTIVDNSEARAEVAERARRALKRYDEQSVST